MMLDDLEKLKNNPPQPTEFSNDLAAKASARATKAYAKFTALMASGIVVALAAIISVVALLMPRADQSQISSPTLSPSATTKVTPKVEPSTTPNPASPSSQPSSATPTQPGSAEETPSGTQPQGTDQQSAPENSNELPPQTVSACQGTYQGFANFENGEFKVSVQFTNSGQRCVMPESQVEFTVTYPYSEHPDTFTSPWQGREIPANGSSWLTKSVFVSEDCASVDGALVEISVEGKPVDQVQFTCPKR